ncbi:DeoR/GlpR family DNA-binding transcription regulator [Hymenobacter volaticus]|uniref:DeoR/GlpR family DNA-binding transcription regulator n=1 Tax=Hymenobacter volaticus TaxID=2932254 RepID=A0ABY4GDL8_9BACT|nr:DeoR/GlpR family DNA-binding transcription regulator [Hymenobacter volaticus]UOQ68997.1 DeoR/GlpR family DNA-binding transcription regulator [Hymenobacter volaticus]
MEASNEKTLNFQLRKQFLLTTLAQQGSLDVGQAAQQLHTTPITIRRDLAQLAAEGLVVRTHGGAVLPELVKNPVAFTRKATAHLAEKTYICQLAASQIAAGDTIFIDCGSTTFPLCSLIQHLKIRVVTNSLPVLFELVNSQVQVVLAGGEVDAERQAMHGTVAVEQLKRYQVDKAFLGVDGFSLQRGLSANSEKEAAISLAVGEAARHVYLLCDASKLEHDKYLQFAPLSFVDTLITDARASPDVLARYREAGLTVLV